MYQDNMTNQLASVNGGADEKPKPQFIALFVIICTLLIAGIVAAIVTAVIRKNPSNIASEVVTHLLDTERPMTVSGTILITPTDEESPIAGIEIEPTIIHQALPASIDLKASIVMTDDGEEIPLHLSAIATADGKLYASISDLTTAIDSFLEAYGVTAAYLDHLDDYPFIATLYDFLSDIEGEWWEIDVSGAYSCAVTALNSYAKDNSAIKTAYQNNPFVTFTAVNAGYTLGIDNSKLQGFLTAARGTEVVSNFLACAETDSAAEYDFAEEYDLIEEYDLTEESDTAEESDLTAISYQNLTEDISLGTPEVYVEIDSDHYLTRLQTSTPITGYEITTNLNFSYGDIKIETPDEYRPISELFEDILETIAY